MFGGAFFCARWPTNVGGTLRKKGSSGISVEPTWRQRGIFNRQDAKNAKNAKECT